MYWVAPFGNLRINSYLHLPAAYRSLSRPSSPLRAKASSVRPCLLSYCFKLYPVQCNFSHRTFELLFQRLNSIFVSSKMSMNFALLKAGKPPGNRTPTSLFFSSLPPGRSKIMMNDECIMMNEFLIDVFNSSFIIHNPSFAFPVFVVPPRVELGTSTLSV